MERRQISILIVEDEAAHADAIRRALAASNEGYQVSAVSSLREFHHEIAQYSPELVISDLNLPDGKAYEILSGEFENRPWPVIVMTASGDEEMAVRAIKSGALDYIVKSGSAFSDVPRIVDRALREWQNTRQRKKAEEALRESEEKHRLLFETMAQGVVYQDREGYIISANPAAERILGLTLDQMQNKTSIDPCWRAIHEDGSNFPGETHPSMVALRTGQPVRNVMMGVFNPPRDEYVWIIINAVPQFKPGERTPYKVYTTFEDITERKHAEEERLEMERRMQHVQKLESLGVLAGGIAHDFNNILMAILGHADLALLELPPMSPARDSLAEIVKAARRAAELCRQMLAYSGRGKFVIERIHLDDLINEMVHLLRTSISKKAILNLNLEKSLPPIEGDATQIRQILMNLITNASEAIGDRSGVITISTGAMDCSRDYLAETSLDKDLREGLYVYLEVSDTGCGMDEKTKRRIFEPFFTTKFTGRGLGMSAVLGIVRGHKGAVRVYSEVGKGTTFKVLFPAVEDTTELSKEWNGSAGDEWKGSGRVLLVDDEETIRAVGRMMLERIGFEVLTASDGQEAVRLYEERKKPIDLVLLDLTMPHMGGEETFRELRRIDLGVRVIISSGYGEQEITARFAGKGLAGFIQKPFSVKGLTTKLREVLDNR